MVTVSWRMEFNFNAFWTFQILDYRCSPLARALILENRSKLGTSLDRKEHITGWISAIWPLELPSAGIRFWKIPRSGNFQTRMPADGNSNGHIAEIQPVICSLRSKLVPSFDRFSKISARAKGEHLKRPKNGFFWPFFHFESHKWPETPP